MRVFICDDEKKIVENIHNYIQAHFPGNEVFDFASGVIMLEQFKELTPDIVLLDIDMPDMNGMDVASNINESGRKCLLIFVTAHDELVYDSFRYHPFAFVRKKYLEAELSGVLKDCEKELENKERTFSFRSEGRDVKLPIEEIFYVESEANYLMLHTVNENYRIRCTMTEIMKELGDEGFIRIHKGFLVNQEAVKIISLEGVKLFSGEELPIGKSYGKEARAELLRYMRS